MEVKTMYTFGGVAVAVPWLLSIALFIIIVILRRRNKAKYQALMAKQYGMAENV